MGRGCYRIPMRQLLVAGTQCENHCFINHGGCKADDVDAIKEYTTCEYAPEWKEFGLITPIEEITKAIKKATHNGESIFIYTPDMFSSIFFDCLFNKLPKCNDDKTYIAINACVRTFIDRCGNWNLVKSKGIKEVWFGVESASSKLRTLYNKPPFSNDELIGITLGAKDSGVNVCWFLVDGDEDTDKTRLETYMLIKKGVPYRANIERLIRS